MHNRIVVSIFVLSLALQKLMQLNLYMNKFQTATEKSLTNRIYINEEYEKMFLIMLNALTALFRVEEGLNKSKSYQR